MRIWGRFFKRREPSAGDTAYGAAMKSSQELVQRMQESSQSTDAFRAVMADIWAQHHNVPFMTTVYQSVREMSVATTDLGIGVGNDEAS